MAQHWQAIFSAAKTSFLQGGNWAWTAGLIAVLLGAALIFVCVPKFPEKDREATLVAGYREKASPPGQPVPGGAHS